jgi:hypothetical protein
MKGMVVGDPEINSGYQPQWMLHVRRLAFYLNTDLFDYRIDRIFTVGGSC